jgi:hypothetical protein
VIEERGEQFLADPESSNAPAQYIPLGHSEAERRHQMRTSDKFAQCCRKPQQVVQDGESPI